MRTYEASYRGRTNAEGMNHGTVGLLEIGPRSGTDTCHSGPAPRLADPTFFASPATACPPEAAL